MEKYINKIEDRIETFRELAKKFSENDSEIFSNFITELETVKDNLSTIDSQTKVTSAFKKEMKNLFKKVDDIIYSSKMEILKSS